MIDIVSPPAAARARPLHDIPSPEQVALGRKLYLDRAPVKTIPVTTGIRSLGVLYRCLDGDFPDGSGIAPAPIPRRRAGVRMRQRMGSRAALVARIWRTSEKQVEEIEERLKGAGLALDERESNARTMATLVKTLRELTAIDEARKPRGKGAQGSGKDRDHDDNLDDPAPRNIDDLRQSLARKLEAFVAGTASPVPDDAG